MTPLQRFRTSCASLQSLTVQTFLQDGSIRRKLKLVLTLLLLVLGPLLIFTLQFYNGPVEIETIASNTTSSIYPTNQCAAEWFPSRYWTRQSKYSPPGNATHIGQQMYGTLTAQHAIWNHQHPSSCQDKKFLLYEASGSGHGIGSVLHVASVALQAALNLDRILVLTPQPNFEWVQGKFCEGTETLDECYFEPFSSCTIFDVFGTMNATTADCLDVPELNLASYIRNTDRVLKTAVYSVCCEVVPNLRSETPHIFHTLLKSGGIPDNFFYWWRAQTVAFIVRPSPRTLRELDRRRGIQFKGQAIAPGTVSVHVRHGDKWKEGKLADDATFLRKAEALIDQHPEGLQRKIFLSTEDPNTVKFFANLPNWTVQYTNATRDASDRNMSPNLFASRIGWDEEFLNSLLNLQMALECEGFVGAINSNWNRLIDELRSTVRCKYDRVYVDVDQGFHVADYVW